MATSSGNTPVVYEEFRGIELLPGNPEEIFEELEVAGSGNFGVVIRARHIDSGDIVAIKQILITGEAEIDNIQREIIILKKCDHPNVVKYYGTYRSLGKLWIVMEYCAGGSVDIIYKVLHHPLPERLIAYVCREVLLGLQYLHETKRIHRDIKGSNILLTDDGHIKVVDFGVSTELAHTFSRRNSFLGTVLWMAPEALLEMDYDEKADIWSLGITLVEMAENGPPHYGMHPARAIFHITRDDPPTLKHKDQWSPQMNIFLKRLLTKDKSIRPSAATLLLDPFVQPENIGTVEEMQILVQEVLQKKAEMSTDLLDYCGSDAYTATFVDRKPGKNNNNGDTMDAQRKRENNGKEEVSITHEDTRKTSDQPSFFTDGTILPLPLLSTQDIAFDALAVAEEEMCSPEEETEQMYQLLAPPDATASDAVEAGVRTPDTVMHATRTLAQVFCHAKTLPLLRKLSNDEETKCVELMDRYGMALKNIYRI